MSGRFAWEKAVRDSDLPPNTRFVLLTMGTYMDKDGFARPAQATLAEATGLSVRAVRRNLDTAMKGGWLAKLRQGRHAGRGAPYASEYQATLPPAGGQERPVASDPQSVDNSPQEDADGPLQDSQEDAGVPQEDRRRAAGGHQCPPNSSFRPVSPARERCQDCDGSGWIDMTYQALGKPTDGVRRCSCRAARARTA